mmetsp:Transcript_22/g.67  ORF Transcript_22/g.67 Transcript_22/m.67 type:complete len:235 (+) Transcript_22:45-749(+)
MPVSVHQVLSSAAGSGDDSSLINGREASQVTIIGMIKTKEEKSMCTTYQIDDGTGFIDVKVWQDSSDDDTTAQKYEEMKEGVYVRVIGQVRSFQGMKSMTAFNMRVLQDPNELTFHLMEVIHTHISLTNAGAMAGNPPPAAAQAGGFGGAHAGGAAAGGFAAAGGAKQTSSLQDEIVDAMKQCSDVSGLSILALISQFGPRYGGEGAVREAVASLVNEGHLYSTIDDDHFMHTG